MSDNDEFEIDRVPLLHQLSDDHFDEDDDDSDDSENDIEEYDSDTSTSSVQYEVDSPIRSRVGTNRTNFSREQLDLLESAFEESHYLDDKLKEDLVFELNVSKIKIQDWFINKRMKLRNLKVEDQQRPDSVPLRYMPMDKFNTVDPSLFIKEHWTHCTIFSTYKYYQMMEEYKEMLEIKNLC